MAVSPPSTDSSTEKDSPGRPFETPVTAPVRSWSAAVLRSLLWQSSLSPSEQRRPCADYVTQREHSPIPSATLPPANTGCCSASREKPTAKGSRSRETSPPPATPPTHAAE